MAVAFLIKLTICCVVRFDEYIFIHTPYAQPESTRPCTSPLPPMSCVLLTAPEAILFAFNNFVDLSRIRSVFLPRSTFQILYERCFGDIGVLFWH